MVVAEDWRLDADGRLSVIPAGREECRAVETKDENWTMHLGRDAGDCAMRFDDIIAIVSDALLIRNLPDSLKPALRRRAAAHGRSVEAEARAILEESVTEEEDFVSWWLDAMPSVPPGEPLPVPDRAGEPREQVTFE